MIPNQWYAILPSKSVGKNEIVAVRRLNLDLALFRNSNGEIGCVVDQCPHRGAALSAGKIDGDCIRCPFHGLEFDKNGKCTFIPANGKASTADISRYNVRHYLVKELNGIIYLWYGDAEKAAEKLPFFMIKLMKHILTAKLRTTGIRIIHAVLRISLMWSMSLLCITIPLAEATKPWLTAQKYCMRTVSSKPAQTMKRITAKSLSLPMNV